MYFADQEIKLEADLFFNEVFELNVSERFDGYNRFVTLRGTSTRWTTPITWWYFPGAPVGVITVGPQKHDSHVKNFMMYCGMHRDSTLGSMPWLAIRSSNNLMVPHRPVLILMVGIPG